MSRNFGRLCPSKPQQRHVSASLVLGQAEGLQVMVGLHEENATTRRAGRESVRADCPSGPVCASGFGLAHGRISPVKQSSQSLDARAPIGVFDSGVGGLTVLKALRERLPGEDFVYLGDTARLPYGRKPAGMVREFATQISSFLLDQGVKAIVMACNTASSCALGPEGDLRERLSVPLWGVIEPGIRAAEGVSRVHGRVGVLGTKGTVASGAYQSRLEAHGFEVWARACPMFVPLVEEGLADSSEARLLVRHYLADRPALDAIILGCTHYPMLKDLIAEELGAGVAIVDSASVTASVVAGDLERAGALNPRSGGGELIHYVTGDPASYQHTSGVIGGVEGELRLLEITELVGRHLPVSTNVAASNLAASNVGA
jgi:glutamate racemase